MHEIYGNKLKLEPVCILLAFHTCWPGWIVAGAASTTLQEVEVPKAASLRGLGLRLGCSWQAGKNKVCPETQLVFRYVERGEREVIDPHEKKQQPVLYWKILWAHVCIGGVGHTRILTRTTTPEEVVAWMSANQNQTKASRGLSYKSEEPSENPWHTQPSQAFGNLIFHPTALVYVGCSHCGFFWT